MYYKFGQSFNKHLNHSDTESLIYVTGKQLRSEIAQELLWQLSCYYF